MGRVIAFIGAGGKTSLIYQMTSDFLSAGNSVFITTSTHMQVEEDTDVSCDPVEIKSKLMFFGYCMAGELDTDEKITALPEEVYKEISEYASITLVEADGAKRMWAKYPAENEPVIPDNVNDVYIIMGLGAIGEPVKDAVFRYELMVQNLGVSEDDIVTFKMLNQIIDKAYLPRINAERVGVLYSRLNDGVLEYLTYEEAKSLYE